MGEAPQGGKLKMKGSKIMTENERLREALTFYADPRAYQRKIINIDDHGCDYSIPEVLKDKGQIARNVLDCEVKED